MEGFFKSQATDLQMNDRITVLERENRLLKAQLLSTSKTPSIKLESLKNTDYLYENLFEDSLDGIIVWRTNGTIVDANDSALSIFESSREALLMKKISDFVIHDGKGFVHLMTNFSNEGIREERQFLMPNGQIKHLEYISKLHGVEGLHISFFRNVSERYRMEADLIASEKKFRSLFEGIIEGIILWNEELKIVDINPAGANLFQRKKEDLLGLCLVEILMELCGYREDIINQEFVKVKEQGWLNGTIIIPLESGDNKKIEFCSKYNVISGLSLTIFKDVTERCYMEEQLRKSDTLNVIGELAAGIAHEIRNPMTAIKGFIQLLEGKIKGQEMYFKVISTELKRIDSIINEFLILAKPQAIKFVKSDLTIIMRETLDLLHAQALLFNVQFSIHFHKSTPKIFCEPNQMKKVFINLIKNGIEVMQNGGTITVSISTTKENMIKISIRDEGSGIPKEKLKKLGEPFYTTKEKGTGLGLMVTYKIIEEHKGFIEVESKVGIGTLFSIYLPIT